MPEISADIGWLSTAHAATYTGLSADRIRDAAEAGDLSGIKVTPGSPRSPWRFTRRNLDDWLERGRVVTPQARRRR